jgi:adenylate kinase
VQNIILIGPPGSGKGTQAEKICLKYGWASLSTGQLMRQEIQNRTPLGLKIQDIMSSGALVADTLVLDVLSRWFVAHQNPLTHTGVILDGFPRTLSQAQSLQNTAISLTQVHCFDIPDELIIKRLSGRRVHRASGRTYHVIYNPPKVEGVDDLTGENLLQRSDDLPEAIEKRLKEYHAHTAPLIDFYQNITKNNTHHLAVFRYDATQDVVAVFSQLEQNIVL